MSFNIDEYLEMVENFLSYLASVKQNLPKDVLVWVDDYEAKLMEYYGKAKESMNPLDAILCVNLLREFVKKLTYDTITERYPPSIFAANIMRNLGYDVRWINEGDNVIPFDLIAVGERGTYLVSVKFSDKDDSNGFQNLWPGKIKYFCEQLNADPLVILICKSDNSFGVIFMAPLIEDVTFYETRPLDLEELGEKISSLKDFIKR